MSFSRTQSIIFLIGLMLLAFAAFAAPMNGAVDGVIIDCENRVVRFSGYACDPRHSSINPPVYTVVDGEKLGGGFSTLVNSNSCPNRRFDYEIYIYPALLNGVHQANVVIFDALAQNTSEWNTTIWQVGFTGKQIRKYCGWYVSSNGDLL